MMKRRFVSSRCLGAAFATLGLLSTPSFASKRAPAHKPKIVAQKLVEEVASKHLDVTSVELAVRSAEGCSAIAASNSKDIGEKCDKDELEPMRTGKPSVEREGNGFDVTMPLHDASGQIIGTVGLDIKAEPSEKESSVIERAKKIVQEVEAQIPSTAKLLEPAD
jgi:hypothetical protein